MSAQTSKSIQHSIQAAMSSLDLKLEDELTLFRNRHSGINEAQPVFEEVNHDPISPIPEDSRVDAHQPDAFQMNTPTVDLAAEAARLLDVKLEDDLDGEGFEEDLDLPSLETPETSIPETLELDIHEDDIPPGAIVPSKALLPSEDALATSAKLKTYTDPALDDYLESSEVLLKHLDTPAPQQQLDDSKTLKWFIWAAGATLVLSVLAVFLLQNVFKQPTSDPSPQPNGSEASIKPGNSSTSEAPATAPSTTPSATVQPPNLEEKEFQSVNPGNLAGLPSPAVSPSASPTPNNSPTPATATGRKYYVVTNYTDEASLETAKASFPDAKIVNFTAGTRIQLQEFSDETSARTAAAEFQQKGFAVEILASTVE
ncbi:MAG: hypothetical protein HC810_04560 [Acaryochloridaceae cyanobacterium RL_2_7]|nr:hypothetical protein [Acaryochloridaceae cyanobacterium RL_2_7]